MASSLCPDPRTTVESAQARACAAPWRVAIALALLVGLAAAAARTANLRVAFVDSKPLIPPYDALYHADRIERTVAAYPIVPAFDPNRGDRGAWCPWPPLWDLTAATVARLTGARSAREVAARIVWLPPLLGTLWVTVVALLATRRWGTAAGLAVGLSLALAPQIAIYARIGYVGHTFLEPALTVGVMWAAARLAGGGGERPARAALLLAACLTGALLVQVALLTLAAALVAALLLAADRSALWGGAVAYALSAAAVWGYGAAQGSGYPGGPWFLGSAHAGCLLAGAGALAAAAWVRGRGGGRASAAACGVLAGAAVLAALPGVLVAVVEGSGFFGGDAWLRSIDEFEPMFVGSGQLLLADVLEFGLPLAAAAVLVGAAWRSLGPGGRTTALAAGALALVALSSVRFEPNALVLVTLAGAAAACRLRVRGRPGLAVAGLVLLAVPQTVSGSMAALHAEPNVPRQARGVLEAGSWLAAQPNGGRVLGMWWWGHALGASSGHGIIIDNFGFAGRESLFAEANAMLLQPDEDRVAAWCARHDVGYVVLEPPWPAALRTVAALAGLPPDAFAAPDAGVREVSALSRASFWWRAYVGRGGPVATAAGARAPLHRFERAFTSSDGTVVVLRRRSSAGARSPVAGSGEHERSASS